MKAVRSTGRGVTVEQVDEPDVEGFMRIAIKSASICATDLLYIRWGSREILGHELAGVLDDGTPVAIEGIFGCGACPHCDRGDYNRCARMGERALGMNWPGGMSEYYAAPRRALVELPKSLDVRNACLCEPGAVAWHGCRVGGVGTDSSVAIVGAGAIGLLAVASAQAQGARDVALEARHAHQRELGERLGATPAASLYDVVIETGGSESALHRSVELARPGGTVVVIGVHDQAIAFPHRAAFSRELKLAFAVGYCGGRQSASGGARREFAEVADLLGARPELVDALITHRFGIEDAPEAFRVAADKRQGVRRVVVNP